jgi:hypothetical protein
VIKFRTLQSKVDGLVKTQNQRINNGAWVKQPENS